MADGRPRTSPPGTVSAARPTWRYRCEFPGEVHDEVFPCHVCDRLVCGYCADPGNGAEWFCPDCAPLVAEECSGE